ncbi:COP9/signalosome complex subunit Csn4 [Schizosaccharomyces pombe]|uniref:COP9 signalosome complex subunit 4 n=1 Tax=Schizosaccharomyces pombe (strain 972 / ATCC 24843) TaxID=284812 RepID=CSN4_SCHPO|nr:COP9/signalosome complex subunit Csn4 [Schizosaccharomyces pombe]O13895.1 RecName: Full=COP9 signalosome complex subunit 4; Short=CSN complex subunit 4; Short=SGN4 [Schizosaccharomyces pombe 972h-]CAB16573.1 COP9/signalosome complex subunit Csn4 [Schizosaccharomyces pombe]|eukprot:NP_593233.1 COP9/signalosome complex subunit Csn4 [Schizosaccharomyces pombe]
MEEVVHYFLEGNMPVAQFREALALHYTNEKELFEQAKRCLNICCGSNNFAKRNDVLFSLLDVAVSISSLELRKELISELYVPVQSLEEAPSEYLVSCCLQLATIYEAEQNFELLCSSLEAVEKHGHFENDLEQLLLLRIRLGDAYLKLGKAEKAILTVRTSIPLAFKVSNDQLLMELQLCNARALDETGQFLEAAKCYYRVLQYKVPGNELIYRENLCSVAQCLLLAIPSPIVLQFLQEISLQPSVREIPFYSLVEKYLKRKFIGKEDGAFLLPFLLPHQVIHMNRLIEDGRHFLETNILFLSEFFEVSSTSILAKHFKLSEEQVDTVVADMVIQERLNASIDQCEGYITFLPEYGKANNLPNYVNKIATVLQHYGS